jgi:hypothetical protein
MAPHRDGKSGISERPLPQSFDRLIAASRIYSLVSGRCPEVFPLPVPGARRLPEHHSRKIPAFEGRCIPAAFVALPHRTTEGSADVVDTKSRSPTERNEADMPVSAAAAEAWGEIRAEARSLPVPLDGMSGYRRNTPFSFDEKTRSVPPQRGPPRCAPWHREARTDTLPYL